VARGGTATVANLRLRCRAHNQFAAEQAFGAGFVQRKREDARRRAAEAKARTAAEAGVATKACTEPRAAGQERCTVSPTANAGLIAAAHEVVPWLREMAPGSAGAERAGGALRKA